MTHGPSAPRDEVSPLRPILSPDGAGIRLALDSGDEGLRPADHAASAPEVSHPQVERGFDELPTPAVQSETPDGSRFAARDSATRPPHRTDAIPSESVSCTEPDLRSLAVFPHAESESVALLVAPSELPAPSRRTRYGAFATSSLMHAALLVVLSIWTLPQIARITEPTIDATIETTSVPVDIDLQPPVTVPDVAGDRPQSRATFVSAAASAFAPATDLASDVARDSAPRSVDPSDLVPFAAEERVAWNEVVGSLAEWSRASFGAGAADGSAGGGGAGTFFGSRVPGRSFVFVVDCSLSMNAPHDSPAKTRFRRVKLEIVRSVAAMTPEDRFFVVFFNDMVHAMPATGLEVAVPESKQRHLEWMTTVRAVGDTDPRGALRLALALRPEVIHFLSDGDFAPQIAREVLSLRQSAAALHTYSFESRKGEKLLRTLAEQNGGEYHAIP